MVNSLTVYIFNNSNRQLEQGASSKEFELLQFIARELDGVSLAFRELEEDEGIFPIKSPDELDKLIFFNLRRSFYGRAIITSICRIRHGLILLSKEKNQYLNTLLKKHSFLSKVIFLRNRIEHIHLPLEDTLVDKTFESDTYGHVSEEEIRVGNAKVSMNDIKKFCVGVEIELKKCFIN